MSDDMSIPNAGYRANRPGRHGRVATGMDPDTRRLMLFAGGLAAVLACLISASALLRHRNAPVPVVMADLRPIRVKPDNPGGMQIDGAENDVFSGGVDSSKSKLAPPAETPNPNGMHLATAAPPKAPVAAQSAAQPSMTTPAPSPARPVAVANAAPPKPANTAPAKAPASATAAATPAAAAKVAAPAGRPAVVQLAAVTTEQAARDEWQHLAKRMPDLLNGRQPSFVRVERDGHTFWRLRTTGFSDVAQARTFCEHVRAKGSGCSVADF